MKLRKKGFTKMVMLGVFVTIILGLVGCNDSDVSQDTSESAATFGLDDLPEWLRSQGTDEALQEFLDGMTPEDLEAFFTEGPGSMDEPPTAPEGSGHQSVFAVPGQDGDCDGAMQMTENGLECIDLEDLDSDLLDVINNYRDN